MVAEHLAPKIRGRYLVQTFGHMYAGRSSIWFYRRWQDGYRAFNKSARAAVNRGLKYTASFDLTACYDSVDHGVLCHFLKEIGCEREFCDFLRQCLGRWTATNKRIYQNHGIPQGPLGSGLLAEVVLQHFDQHTRPNASLVYMRYVDDIRLFATKEADLRRLLVRLDTLSKDIGLFPQASKIDIHKVADIEKELKSISNPTEASVRSKIVNQDKLAKRIVELSPRLTPPVNITDETRFKFLLAYALPSARLNQRMLKISLSRPDLVPNAARYFSGYRKLPQSVVKELISRVRKGDLYEYVTADWVDLLGPRLDASDVASLCKVVKAQWKPKSLSPELKAAAGRLLIGGGRLSANQVRYAVQNVREWWVRAELISALDVSQYGTVILHGVLNQALRDSNPDAALSAAYQVALLGVPVSRPYSEIQTSAGKALRQFGVLRRVAGRTCGIEWSFSHLIGRATGVRWRTVFGSKYSHAERMAVQMKALAETNVTAFVNAADVFNDLLLDHLYRHDTSLGSYALGKIGSILSSTRLRAKYPAVFRLCSGIHEERLKSLLSHAVIRQTGKATNRIAYKYLRTAKRLYSAAAVELAANW